MSDDPVKVRTEVQRCVDEAAAGGGYAIRCGGQIFEATVRNIEVMTRAVDEYGRY